MRAECLLYINVSFSTHTQLNYYLSFVICYFDPNVFMSCMYKRLTLCYIRYISLTRTNVFNSKGILLFIFFLFNSIYFTVSGLHLVAPMENKMAVGQGKLKSMPIICIYVTYVTISLMYDCMFLNIFKTLSNVLQPCFIK